MRIYIVKRYKRVGIEVYNIMYHPIIRLILFVIDVTEVTRCKKKKKSHDKGFN